MLLFLKKSPIDQPRMVKVWQEQLTIPTYPIGQPDRNPMFLEKRVYQGSSGVVYPHAVIDKVGDKPEDREYMALFLENEYLKIMILPELGGRVQMALDKTNGYHFVYYNRVIKPALVGLAGPWISGGIEFNWPQHHRPSTFDPIDFRLEAHEDGSATVWVSEHEKMFHTKGMAGFRLFPGQAVLEITGQLYNRSALPQTFLWWANPAVSVDEHYQSVFPPDVTAVYDHGKRDVSSFPIARGTYYKVDYSPGTDISRYANIPVPTSYMAVGSAFNFMGGYHHEKKAGLLYVADRHVSPGKKQWTWGCGEFGQAWDRQLTDEDGPYFELMTGMYTDNQPDFSWIMPGETRVFRQYFMPYQQVGYVKNATTKLAVNLELEGDSAHIGVYVTAVRAVTIRLQAGKTVFFEEEVALSPEQAFLRTCPIDAALAPQAYRLSVHDEHGQELIAYMPVTREEGALPDPADPIAMPEELESIESLWLAGTHLEQYRHATYSPLPYYQEALRRDPGDSRCNLAMGRWYLRKGCFRQATPHLQRAIERLTRHNPNPYDGEAHYLLGLCYLYLGERHEAVAPLYKSTWNAAWQDMGFLQLARLAATREDWPEAQWLIDQSLRRNASLFQARHLKALIWRRMGQLEQAIGCAAETIRLDGFDFGSRYEWELSLFATGQEARGLEAWAVRVRLMRSNAETYLAIAEDYLLAGAYEEAENLLREIWPKSQDPMVGYFLAWLAHQQGKSDLVMRYASEALACSPDRVFPNRLADIAVLEWVMEAFPQDHQAPYFLGNLWYDKQQYEAAITCWEVSRQRNDKLATVHRNLGLAYFNQRKDPTNARNSFEKAFDLNPTDARVLFELDCLYQRLKLPVADRYAFLSQHPDLVADRDDLSLRFVALGHQLGLWEEGARILSERNFHPWEGGEGKVTGQHVLNRVLRARKALSESDATQAIDWLQEALVYPSNLGEGKLYGAQENDVYFWLGNAWEQVGDLEAARQAWRQASQGLSEPSPALYYNDQPPEKIFYQGLARQKLGNESEAKNRFETLHQYGQTHLDDRVVIDFFAVSLPDLMIFDDDLDARNRLHCHFMMGLGCLGLGEITQAQQHFDTVRRMDPSHEGAWLFGSDWEEIMPSS